MAEHKSGFVNIIGRPNVGKSTLLNGLVGERMSIISAKPQTTRHRILGIVNEEAYQIVFSDTPGMIQDPKYKMQAAMNHFAMTVLEDADILLIMTDVLEERYTGEEQIIASFKKCSAKRFLVINKMDIDHSKAEELAIYYKELLEPDHIFLISALNKIGTDVLLDTIIEEIPIHAPFYPKDQLTDKPERFFISEIIREKIFLQYHQEIPYSCEVVIQEFNEVVKNDAPFVFVKAEIYVMRKNQKVIIIGKGGSSIKQLGIEARKSIEEFIGKRIHLELYVRVKENWRNDDRLLKSFGYVK